MAEELPKVPVQHEVARAAARWVENLLPGAWVTHRPNEGDDYGVDLRIEIAEGGVLTARHVVVQIKGTSDPREVDRLRMKRTTVNYLRSLSDAAAVLRVCHVTGDIRLLVAEDPRLDEDDVWISLRDVDVVPVTDLVTVIKRLSCRTLSKKGRAPVAVGLDSDVAVRRTTLAFEGRLDGIIAFEVADDSAWQQYSYRYIEAESVMRLENLLPRRQRMDIPLEASLTEMISAHVSFLLYIDLGRVGARMLLKSAPLLGNKIVNMDALVSCAASFLTPEECSTILRVSVENQNVWPAQWMAILLKSGVPLHVDKEVVERAFLLQQKRHAFAYLPLWKAQVLLSIGEPDAASQAADEALSLVEERTPVFYFELTNVLALCGRRDECVSLLDEARRKSTRPQIFAIEQAKYLMMMNRSGEASIVLETIDEPESDPLKSLYRLTSWLSRNAGCENDPTASRQLKRAWTTTRAAFQDRHDGRVWATATLALELCDETKAARIAYAALFYSAVYFGGDVVRLVLEHPSAESFGPSTVTELSRLALDLDAWRGGMVALSERDGELETIRVLASPDE